MPETKVIKLLKLFQYIRICDRGAWWVLSQMVQVVKNRPASTGDARDAGLIPGSGRSPGVGNGNPLQFSCLEDPIDRGAWWAAVHGVTKGQTRLSG